MRKVITLAKMGKDGEGKCSRTVRLNCCMKMFRAQGYKRFFSVRPFGGRSQSVTSCWFITGLGILERQRSILISYKLSNIQYPISHAMIHFQIFLDAP